MVNKAYPDLEIWFVTGSQHLYGPETLARVDLDAKEIAGFLQDSALVPVKVVWKPVVTVNEEIFTLLQQAGSSKHCIGIIAWMHTFSPAKMWIRGLEILNKPLLHLHTQFNQDIPWETIDMDFMNLNQSAHGDREFGFLMSRMRRTRKVVVGHWKDPAVLDEVGLWCRAAAGWADWQGARFARFGDNMRQVAVTEGDKVEAEIKFGYTVNTYGIGDLVEVISGVSDGDVSKLIDEYLVTYVVTDALMPGGERHGELRDAARIEAGLLAFLTQGDFKGFTDTFEDLHGLKQLPGIAAQRLMARGYGFAAEGDWKTAALVRAMKVMGTGLPGGNAFMEDYTYHLNAGNPMVLGSHMLEICPSIASGTPRVEVHPLSIGQKADPVRLVFEVSAGPALNATIIDMGNRFRLLIGEVEAVASPRAMQKLPVAKVLWKPLPDFKTASHAWILAGGAHHTGYSQNLTAQHLTDFAEIAGVECVLIDARTEIRSFKNELRWNDIYYKLQ